MASIRDFNVGDKVRFGRGRGEQTLGTVVGLGRTKLQVRQDEARGRNKSHAVGSVWTVPASLCVKVESGTESVAPTPRPQRPAGQTPREILAAKGIQAGDIVEFTFRKADGILQGRIDSINAKRVTIKDVNSPKYPAGVYCNPTSIIRKLGSLPVQPTTRLPLAVGQTVTYQGFSWSARGLATVTGVVTKVNHAQGTYEVVHGHRTTVEKASAVTKAPRRSDADIVDACLSIYGALSPENLTCDGEASRSHVRQRSTELHRALKALWAEAGRQINEDECYRAWDARRASK